MPGTNQHHDVVVVGGGSAGVGAAVGAADAGADTLLIESAGCLGGAASLRGVITYCGIYSTGAEPRQVVHGVAEQVLAKLRARDALTGPHRFRGVFVVFDPETNKLVLDEVCAEAGVQVQFHTRLISAQRDEDRIVELTVQDHGGPRTITADAFIDATGEADLAHLAGAATRYGNDGEVNLASLSTRFGGVPGTVDVSADQLAAEVEALATETGRELTKRASVVVRLPVSGDLCVYVASADYDPRDAASISVAEAYGRRQAQHYLDAVRRIDGCHDAYLVSTGPEFGTRESRHLETMQQITWDDIESRRSFDDCIALGGWGAEWHDRATYVSTLDLPPEGEPFQIPLGCIRSIDTPNLFAAGRTADGDRKAGAAIRVMGTAFATGQAAGVAATQLSSTGTVDPATVQTELARQGATLLSP